jgi:hypothetical protein
VLGFIAVPSETMRTLGVQKERVTSQPHNAIPVSEYPQGSGAFHVRGARLPVKLFSQEVPISSTRISPVAEQLDAGSVICNGLH